MSFFLKGSQIWKLHLPHSEPLSHKCSYQTPCACCISLVGLMAGNPGSAKQGPFLGGHWKDWGCEDNRYESLKGAESAQISLPF